MGDVMKYLKKTSKKHRDESKNSGSLFAAQCIVSAALIVAGIVIYNIRTPFMQPAQVAFSQVITKDSGIEEIAGVINAFAEKTGLMGNEN